MSTQCVRRLRLAGVLAGTLALTLGTRFALGTPTKIAKVDAGPVADRIVARASVVASAGVRRVYAEHDGRVVRVLAREGDSVQLGQSLAELEAGGQTRPLAAPQRGVVLASHCELGDYAFAAEHASGQSLFELADPAQTELRVEVEESDAARLALEQPVTIRLQGLDGKHVTGQVVRVAARLQPRRIGADDARVRADGLVRVATVAWRDGPPDWPLGTRAEASIEVRRREAAARVPRAALTVRDGRTLVERPQLLWTREVPVEIVTVDEAYAEIRGLAVGSEVVVPTSPSRSDVSLR